jgi:ribosomal protein S18 acetylase RimI-like enzyme
MEHVGLNVRIDNASAVACYERIGFERFAEYGEYTVAVKTESAREAPACPTTGSF